MRRNLTKGQKAMALAMMYPEPTPGKKRKTSSVSEEVTTTRLSNARTVLHHSRSLAEAVLKGYPPLDAAHYLHMAHVQHTETKTPMNEFA